MPIEIQSTKGLVEKSGVKMLIVASPGMGKTNLARSTGKTIMISVEAGDLTLNDIDVSTIKVRSISELKEAYGYVKEHVAEYDTLIIDSLTEIGEMIVAELKREPEYSDMSGSMKMWMKYTDIITAIAKSFRDLDGINVVILALEESVKMGFDEKILPLIPAKKAQAKLGSLYDEVFQIKIDDAGQRYFVCHPTPEFDAKDRSGALDARVDYDKELGLQPIFHKILEQGK